MKIVIYTKNNCDWCRLAKNWLDSNNLSYEERDVEHTYNLEAYKKDCKGEYYVPQIIVNGQLIKGGYTGLICSGLENRYD